ncbi:MAG: hypothetical protein OEY85_02600 [Rhodospirillales bacterium]|nr:hypothetical protein [Rhodospirillales bacterium]
MHMKQIITVIALTVFLAACGDPSKQEIIKETEKVSTKSELEKILGKPKNVDKLGPVEKWTYKASDGEVTFLITGDRVALSATGSGGK